MLPGKCQGLSHRHRADRMADAMRAMGCKQPSGCYNAARSSPSARPGCALSLSAGAKALSRSPAAAGEGGGSNGETHPGGRCLSCSWCWSSRRREEGWECWWLVFPSCCPHSPSAQAGEMKGQPLVPTPDLSESGSIFHVADSTSSELPSDLGMCQELPAAAAARAELPSPSGPSRAPAGSPSSGKAGRQLAAGRFLPAGAAVGLIQLELPCLAPQASWCHRQQREGWSQLGAAVSRRGLPARQPSLEVQQCEAAPRQAQGLRSPLQVLPATQPASLQLPPLLGTCSLSPSSQRGTQWVLP